MKNLKIALGLLISLIFAGNSYAWTITDFHSDIQLNADGSANVTETIQANFSRDLQKHGIYRFIPLQSKTDTGMLNRTPISQVSVFNEMKIPRNFRQETKNDNILLVIGDPNRTVQPQETYVIKYLIENVPKEFPENNFAEFYWNVTGSDWETTIKKASATISMPKHSQTNKTICFTGKHGSKEKNCTATFADGKANFATQLPLYPGEGLTVVYGFDEGIVQTFDFEELPPQDNLHYIQDPEPTWLEIFFNKIGGWGLGLLALVYPIFYARQEKKKVAVDKPIIPKYEPPQGIHPSLLGTVIDNSFDKKDFTAGIIDLAVNGYLEIEKRKVKGVLWGFSDEYFLKRNPAKKRFSSEIQKEIYEGLFKEYLNLDALYFKDLSKLTKNDFANMVVLNGNTAKETGKMVDEVSMTKLRSILYSIFKNIEFQIKKIGKQYFRGISGQGIGIILALIVGVGGLGLLATMSMYISEIVVMGLFGGGIIGLLGLLILFPKRTKEGFELAHEAKCYREFLETADIDKLDWAEKQEIFEKNLPYAVAFGLTEKWAKVFGDTIVEPRWMRGSGGVGNLAKNLDQITSDIAGNIQAPHSSSGGSGFGGGGFSGGGSGGGGGGSW